MDYKRIYDQFILDRWLKEPASGYVERHHIVPRSFGGSDSPENIIRLTAEDHYFAHCCLAKIYGGKMWFALQAISMIAQRRRNPYSQRRMLERAKIEGNAMRKALLSKMRKEGTLVTVGLRGADNGNHNAEVFNWVNLDNGMRRDATIHAMWIEFGGSRPKWTQVQSGVYKTCFGWTLVGREIRIRGMKGKTRSFVSPEGEVKTGTQGDLCAVSGMSVASASRLFRGMHTQVMGWSMQC